MASYWRMPRLLLPDQKDHEDKKLKKCYNKIMDNNNIELTDEEISKGYESDNEQEDNWDNLEKACWRGYKQVGMKDKGGRKVPNCVPVKKSLFGTEGPQTLIPRNS